MIRVLHFSDVHVQEPMRAMPVAELMTKRLLAAGNLWLRRGKLFRDAPEKLAELARFAERERVDAVICTGDYTAVGSEAEYASARVAIEPFTRARLGFFTLPGNHDLYLHDTLRDARWERHFGALQKSDLPELAVDGVYPFVRFVGDELCVIGVNSARPNPHPLRSSGRVPDAQLEALARALDHARVRERFVLVMTHYGPFRRDGSPDSEHHGLDNAEALLRTCARPRVALVHGHIHHGYAHAAQDRRPWLFCAGSATHRGREAIWLYELERGTVSAVPGRFDGGAYVLAESERVQVT